MPNIEILLMKCDNCNQTVDCLIRLRESRKSIRMRNDSKTRNLKKVCIKCAVWLNKPTPKFKALYNFGSYWSDILKGLTFVYFNRGTGCRNNEH